ncbi:MAG: very short patch repair endonuclease [Betaproteobacteria bacterium]
MDTIGPKQRSEVMRRVRSKDTGPEMVVRRLVHSMGHRYRLHSATLPGRPDLVFAGRRKVVFVHGCFWHQHRGCGRARMPSSNRDYWVGKIKRNVSRDREVVRALRRAGWGVLTVWECELSNMGRLAERLGGFLDE